MADPDIPLATAPPMAPPPMAPHLSTAPIAHPHPGDRVNPEIRSISAETLRTLLDQGYTRGLAQALQTNTQVFEKTIWVVDNSGSMQKQDGHRIVIPKNKRGNQQFQIVPCTRWTEMQQTVEYHVQLAALLHGQTTFRLLNDPGHIAGPQTFHVGVGDANDVDVAVSTIRKAQPSGVTPLHQHILEIRNEVLRLEPALRQHGRKVVIVLATDGLPTDAQGYSNALVQQQFVDAMRSLQALPIWIVVRLCTDEDQIVNYWNDLDGQLEISLEVLDDFTAEAAEVNQHNRWLTYGLPIHRMRELGFHHRVFDLLDERKLSKDEVGEFCKILFGDAMAEAPDPEADWKGFTELLRDLLAKEQKVWNPLEKKSTPWINLKRLSQDYGGSGWFGMW